MEIDEFKLDNPVWHSLSESHRKFSLNYSGMKFYHPDYCTFGASGVIDEFPESADEYSNLTDSFFIVGGKPRLSDRLKIYKKLICLQMIIRRRIDSDITENIIPLSDANSNELYDLVNFVQPGYFRNKTFFLGNYYGIFKNGRLVSVTGERMKMRGYTEVSAIVTHPDHTGKGYAKQLVAHTVNQIFTRERIPFLHVAETNTAAVRLYEKSGFTVRRKMSFWNITVRK
ncbi:MAG: GNAT family N-acetyltransferase [Bacteroidetes bacterium]|nr:GNAT family N-acetyltransferase [Bacteroidota bacterium]